jgi:hypothetical protein
MADRPGQLPPAPTLTPLQAFAISDVGAKVRLADARGWPAVPMQAESVRALVQLLEAMGYEELIRDGCRRMDQWLAAHDAKTREGGDS